MSAKKIMTPTDIQLICAWIEEQAVKVTFPAIREACPSITGKEFSIVALRRPAIVIKVGEKNDRIALGEITDVDELPSKRDVVRQLRVRAQVLQAENDNLAARISTMIYNASRMGYSFDELERQPPPPKRPTREQHERRIQVIEDKTRQKVEKQREHEKRLEAKQAEKKTKEAAKARREAHSASA